MSALPLQGVRVVVTRAVHQAAALAAAFEEAGAEVALLPLIEVMPPADERPLARAAEEVASFDWVAFTSANAVHAFLPRLAALSRMPRAAAVGPATSEALRSFGVEPAIEAADSRGTGLAEAMAPWVVSDARSAAPRVLVPGAEDARRGLTAALRDAGAEVTAVVAYRKRLPASAVRAAGRLFATAPLGWVTFTSPRIVRHFRELLAGSWPARRAELRAISIGPTTSRELRRHGVEPAAEAARPTPDEMVRAVVRLTGSASCT